jgi:Na+-translocating ferredoxin:NAD+ oxidoreductase RnfE subunit
VALTVVALRGGDLSQLRERYNVLVYVALGASVALDVWNCAALCWNLGRAGRQAKERGVMNAIMLWAIETGLATTAAAAVVLVCWVVWPSNGLWLCFFFIYSKREFVF